MAPKKIPLDVSGWVVESNHKENIMGTLESRMSDGATRLTQALYRLDLGTVNVGDTPAYAAALQGLFASLPGGLETGCLVYVSNSAGTQGANGTASAHKLYVYDAKDGRAPILGNTDIIPASTTPGNGNFLAVTVA
jgi:hypothetical protein